MKIVEKDNGSVTSTKQFVWIPRDPQPSEERDASNNVTKRFYPEGMQIGSTNYYYTRDHLGSIRELADSSGVLQARYDYDPYGRRTKVSGTLDADFGYTGHYYHQPGGLNLALYRGYDADLGRWISRDPIAEQGGINLYGYMLNSPIADFDAYGLFTIGGRTLGEWGQGFRDSLADGSLGEALKQGAAATADGLIPFWDPFADNGFYDPCDPTLQLSKAGGEFGRNALLAAAALRGAGAAGGTRIGRDLNLNNNPYLRIGPGRMPARGSLPAGPQVPRISIGRGPGNPHIDLRIRPFD